MNSDFTDITKKLKRGEKEAFKFVYEKFHNLLFHVSVEYVINEEDAKNIVQNAYLKLWESKEQLNDNSNIKNYLFTVVKNESLNHIKKLRNRNFSNNYLLESELYYNQEALERLTPKHLEFEELKTTINKYISDLTPRCKQIFKLSRLEERKNKEIAAELGISIKSVEANITRALKHIRKGIREYLPYLIGFLFIQ